MALSDMIPPAAATKFLADAGWGGARLSPLAGDASFRRYFRVEYDGRYAVLMDAPPPEEDVRPFVAIAEYLRGIGLNAPNIFARDIEQGLLLIEDFGGNRMREAVDEAREDELPLYQAITDVLVELHGHPAPQGLKRHGLADWLDEVELLIDWYGPYVGLDLPRDSFRAAWEAALTPVDARAIDWVTELRDYHAENVMLIDGANGLARFGLLDFQDARIGHPAYDLVSMLEDARRDVSPEVEQACLAHYVAATGRDADFVGDYWALGAQRNTRILGLFCRLAVRDAKPGYKKYQPRMWGLVERDLAHPRLAPVRAWFDAHIPPSHRADFWLDMHA